MNPYFKKLKAYIDANPPTHGDGESVLTMLYEFHNEVSVKTNGDLR